jgi:hypothetical protein
MRSTAERGVKRARSPSVHDDEDYMTSLRRTGAAHRLVVWPSAELDLAALRRRLALWNVGVVEAAPQDIALLPAGVRPDDTMGCFALLTDLAPLAPPLCAVVVRASELSARAQVRPYMRRHHLVTVGDPVADASDADDELSRRLGLRRQLLSAPFDRHVALNACDALAIVLDLVRCAMGA